jgi:hypothetical protein
MSLLARRGLQLFEEAYRRDPEGEVTKMRRMVTEDTVPVRGARQ